MLSTAALQQQYDRLGLSGAARKYVSSVCESEPSRKVGGHARKNRTGDYYSEKMGHTIQTESKTGENTFVVLKEYDSKCYAIYDQAQPLSIKITTSNGRKRSCSYTADYLTLEEDGVFITEVKTQNNIQQLLASDKHNFIKVDGHYEYAPAKEAFQNICLEHRVFVSDRSNILLADNLAHLIQTRTKANEATPELIEMIGNMLSTNACMTLDDIRKRCGITSSTALLQLIDREFLLARPTVDLFTQLDRTWVALSDEYLQALPDYAPKLNESFEAGEGVILPSSKALKRALLNQQRISNSAHSSSSRRYWNKKIEKALSTGRSELAALTPKWGNCGNKEIRFNDVVLQYFEKYLKETSELAHLSYYKRWQHYYDWAKNNCPEFIPMGRDAFRNRMERRSVVNAQERGGDRAELAATQTSAVDDRAIVATRAFQVAHADHFLTDLFCVVTTSGGKEFVARAWLSVLIDAYSKKVLSFWLSFQSPSRRACAMLMRECARAYGRLPETIITDSGPEFDSIFFRGLLAEYKVNKEFRPVGNPRYGSEAERVFGIIITAWLQYRPGYISDFYSRRAISKNKAPENLAALKLEDLIKELQDIFGWYNDFHTINRDTCPNSLWDQSLLDFPHAGRVAEDDEKLIINTAIECRTYTVNPKKGIQTEERTYWHPLLASLAGARRKKIEVLEDPANPYVVYAYLKGKWITCKASGDTVFQKTSYVHQLAEAIRFLDGRQQRQEAKKHASRKRFDLINEANKRLEITVKTPAEKVPMHKTDTKERFTQARRRKVKKLSTLSRG